MTETGTETLQYIPYVLFGSISLHSVVYWIQLFKIKALYMVLKRVHPVVIGVIKQITSYLEGIEWYRVMAVTEKGFLETQ